MWKLFFTLALISLMLVGCTSNEEPGMEGYIVNKENGRILVVESVPKDFSSSGGLPEFYNAIYFSDAPNNVNVGDKVQVWFDAVAESYPGQSRVEKIEILTTPKPEYANLTHSEVIRQALGTVNMNQNGISLPIIKAVMYDAKLDVWNVTIKQNEEEISIDVKDD
ncbi:YobA family protein [Bacillus sp. Marseille-P3661]|uniref:YobA family protein n=1 Tax=Bacillus sp. Marseille-P3661 TaxID=1936234 RepID=UPI002155591F|nr:YobA family protein [Bacillus sp. Marseille-P3661]